MSNFNQTDFSNFIIGNNILGFFAKPVKLKSGRMSNWYINFRDISNDVYLLDKTSDFILSFVKDLGKEPYCFYGVPEGATKLAVLLNYKFAKANKNFSKGSHVLPMGRGKAKEHGMVKDKYFVGEPKGDVIVIEDVTTTGGSLLTSLKHLKELGVNVIHALGLANRMEKRDDGKSVKEAVEELGVPYSFLSKGTDLLPLAIKKFKPEQEIVEGIVKEFEKFGVEKLII